VSDPALQPIGIEAVEVVILPVAGEAEARRFISDTQRKNAAELGKGH
jgi:hypothetical protein